MKKSIRRRFGPLLALGALSAVVAVGTFGASRAFDRVYGSEPVTIVSAPPTTTASPAKGLPFLKEAELRANAYADRFHAPHDLREILHNAYATGWLDALRAHEALR